MATRACHACAVHTSVHTIVCRQLAPCPWQRRRGPITLHEACMSAPATALTVAAMWHAYYLYTKVWCQLGRGVPEPEGPMRASVSPVATPPQMLSSRNTFCPPLALATAGAAGAFKGRSRECWLRRPTSVPWQGCALCWLPANARMRITSIIACYSWHASTTVCYCMI